MNPLVSDAGPIISAARAGQLALLRRVVSRLVLPPAVYKEIVVKGTDKPGSSAAVLASWTEVRPLTHPGSVLALPQKLGAGEREAITLAGEPEAGLLIDGPEGRKAATRKGNQVVGTLGVLRQAKEAALIQEAKPVLDLYRANGFRIGKHLYEFFLRELAEM